LLLVSCDQLIKWKLVGRMETVLVVEWWLGEGKKGDVIS